MNLGILKYRLLSKYVIVNSCLLFICLLISWAFSSGFIEIIFMDYNAPDLIGRDKSDIQTMLLSQILTWPNFVSSSMFYLINFLPVFFALPILFFLDEKRSFFVLGKSRFSNFPRAIVKSMFTYSLISSLSIVTVFLLFYSIGGLFLTNSLDYIGEYASILPTNFYAQHPYLFFVFMICTIYFSLSFVISMFACGIVLWVDEKYKVIVYTLLLYLFYGLIGSNFDIIYFDIFSCATAFNTLYSTFETFVPLLLLVIITVIITFLGIKNLQKKI